MALLNQFKVGSATALFGADVVDGTASWSSCGASRLAAPVKAKGRNAAKGRGCVQVRVAEQEGWLRRTVSSGVSTIANKVRATPGKSDPNNVHMKATIVISKKLLQLDLVDRVADLQDDLSEILGHKVSVTLVSNNIDPKTGKAVLSKEVALVNWITTADLLSASDFDFHLDFYVPKDFGAPGAILVENEHPNEFNCASFSIVLPDNTTAHYATDSWVCNTKGTKGRIFFRNQVYLPNETPEGLKEYREKELQNLRGDGTGKREFKDRIYDYEAYNDLGRPDEDPAKVGATYLGERRCAPVPPPMPNWPSPIEIQTVGIDTVQARNYAENHFHLFGTKGPVVSLADASYESRTIGKETIYIPRDERFDRVKNSDFKADTYRSKLHAAPTNLENKIKGDVTSAYESLAEVKALFAPKGDDLGGLNNVLPGMEDVPKSKQNSLVFLQEFLKPDGQGLALKYPLPKIMHVDEHAWEHDDEFSREFLAGLNPVVIKRVEEFPVKSSLDAVEFGDPVSAITEKHIAEHLEGLTAQQAVEQKKLFTVDYHDMFLPYLNRINAQEGSAAYATRGLFFLSQDETLKVLALELVLPPKDGKDKRSRVFTPPRGESTKNWAWELAKAHVQSNDIFVHQVISHFSRCHAVTEPYLLATNRQLSALHPVNQHLQPHFKSTMETNIAARGRLVSAGGIIETVFTPQRYSMEMAATDYGKNWTFEKQMPPEDLISRGMAVPDASGRHGIKLVVEDYPYAADGLELWEAINSWNSDYVNIYYKDDKQVQLDDELQSWWEEIQFVGHGDKADAPGWPEMSSRSNLAKILCTIQWVVSCQHAAVNFGQYHYGGFMPHHPTSTRRLIPEKDSPEWKEMSRNPEKFFLSCLSSKKVTTTAMSVYEVLSAHSPDEEYIGQRANPNWTANEDVKAAFKKFSDKIAGIENLIVARNSDEKLKNRRGPVNFPYELQRPFSKQGITGKGIPNSITI